MPRLLGSFRTQRADHNARARTRRVSGGKGRAAALPGSEALADTLPRRNPCSWPLPDSSADSVTVGIRLESQEF